MKKCQGSCGCGAINYEITGDPINLAFCYCTECQIHTGSDKWFGIWIPKDNFTFTKGSPATFTRKGDSGEDMIHQFCSDCSTTLCVDVTVAGFYSVAVTTLKEGDNLSPNIAIYTASAPKWAVFPERVPKFDKLPPEMG